MTDKTCPYCETIFFIKVIRYTSPILAPLTPVQELRDKLLDLTGEDYVQVQNNYCPMCGRDLRRVDNV